MWIFVDPESRFLIIIKKTLGKVRWGGGGRRRDQKNVLLFPVQSRLNETPEQRARQHWRSAGRVDVVRQSPPPLFWVRLSGGCRGERGVSLALSVSSLEPVLM